MGMTVLTEAACEVWQDGSPFGGALAKVSMLAGVDPMENARAEQAVQAGCIDSFITGSCKHPVSLAEEGIQKKCYPPAPPCPEEAPADSCLSSIPYKISQ